MKWSVENLELLKNVLIGATHDESAWLSLGTWAWNNDSEAPAWKRRIGRWVHRFLAKRNWVLVRQCDYQADRRDLGEDWPLIGYTMIGRKRLDQLHESLETILREDVPGNLIETGVWRGGSCMLMKATLAAHGDSQRTVYLADSFTGLPPPKSSADGWDLNGNPYFDISSEQVRRNFERFNLWDDRVKLIKGWFQDTLATTPTGPLALLRLDGDLYESTRVALEALYDRVSPGGYIIVDDYHSWPGCGRAVDEFIRNRNLSVSLIDIDENAVFWRKTSDPNHIPLS